MKVECGMLIAKEEEYDGDVLHIISDGYSRRKKSNFILGFLMGPKGNGFRSLLLRDSARSQIGLFADD